MTNNNTMTAEEARQAEKRAKAEQKRLRKVAHDATKLAAQQAVSAEQVEAVAATQPVPAAEAPKPQDSQKPRKSELELRQGFEKALSVWKRIAARMAKDEELAMMLAEAGIQAHQAIQLAVQNPSAATGRLWAAINMANEAELRDAYLNAQETILGGEVVWKELTQEMRTLLHEAKAELATAGNEKEKAFLRLKAANKAGFLAREARRHYKAAKNAADKVQREADRQAWLAGLTAAARVEEVVVEEIPDARFTNGKRTELRPVAKQNGNGRIEKKTRGGERAKVQDQILKGTRAYQEEQAAA